MDQEVEKKQEEGGLQGWYRLTQSEETAAINVCQWKKYHEESHGRLILIP